MVDDNIDYDDYDKYPDYRLKDPKPSDYIVSNVSNCKAVFNEIKVSDFKQKKENEMRYVDLDGDNLCPHDKCFEDCDDCLDKEILRLRNLIEEQENIIVDTRIELRKLSKGWQY